MREKCADCVRKHFGAAVSVIPEILTGYDDFGLYVAGELSNAEQECMKLDIQLANSIRDFRIGTLAILDGIVSGTLSLEEGIMELPEHTEIREQIMTHCMLAQQEADKEEKADGEPDTPEFDTKEDQYGEYTVVLKYPDYLTDGAFETYLQHVRAVDPKTAVLRGQMTAADINKDTQNYALYEVAAVFTGWITDVRP